MQEHTVTQANGSKRVVGFLTRVDGFWAIPHQPQEKTLAAERSAIQVSVVDERHQRLMVSLQVELVTAVEVMVEMFTCPHGSQTFFLYLCVTGLGRGEGAGAIGDRGPLVSNRLQQNSAQTVAGCIGTDTDGFG